MTTGRDREGGPAKPMSDGAALDEMTAAAEKWAASYRLRGDEDDWRRDFDERHERLAEDLATKSTASARPFAARDWILGIVLWLLIGMAVFVFSVFVMQLSGTWTIVFGVFAALIALVGFWQSYAETTSELRAEKRHAKKRTWLLDVSRRAALDSLRARRERTAA